MIPASWKLVFHRHEILSAITNLANTIDSKYKDEDVLLCSILKGAVYFTVDLSRAMKIDHSLYFIEAQSYIDQVQKDKVNISGGINIDKFKNKKIILLDELYDSGKTINTIKTHLIDNGIDQNDITVCVLLKKNKTTEYEGTDLVGIDNIYDVWYVGYGLDDNGKLRNLTDLYAVPKSDGIPKNDDDKFIFGN